MSKEEVKKKTTKKSTKAKNDTPKVVEEVKETIEEIKTEVKEEIEEVKEELVETKEEAKEVIENVQNKVEEIMEEVKEEVNETKNEVSEFVDNIQKEVTETISEEKKEKKKFKVNKKIVYTILVILLIIGGYFGFKAFCLKYYDITSSMSSYEIEEYGDFIKGYKASETWTLKYKSLDRETPYLGFKNILIRDDFSQFKVYEEQNPGDFIKYMLYDENDKVVASFWMGITDTYVNMFKTTTDVFGTEDRRVMNFDKEDFLDDNNITTDLELFEYLVDNHGFEHDLLTPVSEMQKDYTIDFLSYIALPKIDHLTLLEGEFTGYILNLDSGIKEVSLLYKGKRYIFTFIGEEYFTDEYVKDLLDTIVID